MKRYNFDTVPQKAMGYSVHANTMKSAIEKVGVLAKRYDYLGKLVFRDNEKCVKRKRPYRCEDCYPK